MPIITRATTLYKEMDIIVHANKLNYIISSEEDFIKSICGRIIPFNCSESITISDSKTMLLHRLNADIGEMIKFYKIQKSWSDKTKLVPSLDTNDAYMCARDTYIETYAPFMNTYDVCKMDSHFIIFNTMYNIALVVSDDALLMRATCKEFPDFMIVEEIKHTDALVEYKTCFDKKSFANIEALETKLDAYKKFHDILKKDGAASAFQKIYDVVKTTRCKTRVFNILETLYNVTSDQNVMIKASIVYDDIYDVINKASIVYDDIYEKLQDTCNKSTLVGICLEFGLERSREPDGYYYRGISAKFEKPVVLSFDDIVKRREHEIEWCTKAKI
jgi:hypothetical protein